MRRFGYFAIAVALAGCAASPQGARRPPEAWQQSESLSNCGSTDGRFVETGRPGPANVQGLEQSVWPVMASLSAMIRTGANGMPRTTATVVSIEIVDGRPHFKAYDAAGADVPLMEREWWCEDKALMTRTVLGSVPTEKVPEVRDESIVRLWRAADGALIAEQTLESVTPGLLGSSSHHRGLTRSYFRFDPAAPAAASVAAR
jgi:hypothetical protein